MIVDDGEGDVSGHGTACAGIIRSLAPEVILASARVLGPDVNGRFATLGPGSPGRSTRASTSQPVPLRPQPRIRARPLRTRRPGRPRGTMLVCSAHHLPVESYPWRFASVVSVGSHDEDGPVAALLQPRAARRVLRARRERPDRMAGRRHDPRHGEQLRRAARTGLLALIRSKHPAPDALRAQDRAVPASGERARSRRTVTGAAAGPPSRQVIGRRYLTRMHWPSTSGSSIELCVSVLSVVSGSRVFAPLDPDAMALDVGDGAVAPHALALDLGLVAGVGRSVLSGSPRRSGPCPARRGPRPRRRVRPCPASSGLRPRARRSSAGCRCCSGSASSLRLIPIAWPSTSEWMSLPAMMRLPVGGDGRLVRACSIRHRRPPVVPPHNTRTVAAPTQEQRQSSSATL